MRNLKITESITRRTPTLEKYLQEIGKEPLISVDEEVELAQRIKQGDAAALEKMVKANLRFSISVAKQYQNQGLSLSDLINEGNLGLVKAAQRFEATRGFKFISYAVWWIRQRILQSLANNARLVRLPLNKVGELNKITKVSSRLEQDHERVPSVDEIAEIVDITSEKAKELLPFSQGNIPLDAPASADDEMVKVRDNFEDPDSPTPDKKSLQKSLQIEIDRVLKTLPEKEADVLRMHFGLGGKHDPMTLSEVGEKFGLTRERVRQIRETAIRRLKNGPGKNLLKKYLGE